ncbi:hypothetical protein MSG37_15520, partial [Shewanella sp. 1CM18E]|uniref:hypothetical protein n=1 Tax=Shewanella sp. 1CM18E TaxID=2929169 RepID=UPI0020BF7DF4
MPTLGEAVTFTGNRILDKFAFSILQTPKRKKARYIVAGFDTNLAPGNDLLSHGETPHYHRRYCVSLL